jgi:predicted Fe-S protein YdhL (DUF1289 family)
MKTTSPCTNVCRLEGADLCVGCFRSRDEIAGWMQMNDHEKAAVNAALAGRRETFIAANLLSFVPEP